eukprot:m.139122 g.139122  ORF g.139122 m.139122 type:complete len:102 (+) comp14008_c0_seq12:1218-1523(+)
MQCFFDFQTQWAPYTTILDVDRQQICLNVLHPGDLLDNTTVFNEVRRKESDMTSNRLSFDSLEHRCQLADYLLPPVSSRVTWQVAPESRVAKGPALQHGLA